MFKGLIAFFLLVGCIPKKPESTKVVEEPSITIVAGSCYRYPNAKQEDIHVKIIRTYDKGGFFGEFIHNQIYFNYIHEFKNGTRHIKEIDCALYDDLKSISKPAE